MTHLIDKQRHFADLLAVTNQMMEDILDVYYEPLQRKGDEFHYHVAFEDDDLGPLNAEQLEAFWAGRLGDAYERYGERVLGAFMQHLQAEYSGLKPRVTGKPRPAYHFKLMEILLKIRNTGMFTSTCQICEDQ